MRNLSLNYTGIGSLPFSGKNAPNQAVDFIFDNFSDIPFWPQLPHYRREEDMAIQFSQNMAGLTTEGGKTFFDYESDVFFEKLEELFFDYEEVTSKNSLIEAEDRLNKYKIAPPYSSAIDPFLNRLKELSPSFVKGSITGAFTFSTSINDKYGKSAFYDETIREVIVKTLTLKALWQIKEFKKAAPSAIPIIFMDEPSISQIGSCAFLTVKNEEVVDILKAISFEIKKYGAISGVHCCGKTDWDIALGADLNVINFDAYSFAQSISLFVDRVKNFLENGGYLALGIVPTLSDEILQKLDVEALGEAFENSISFLTKKGIPRELIMKQSFITPSCGCGTLTCEGAKKALHLTKELSEKLRSEE